MSTLKVVNIQHPSAASATLILDSSGNLALPASSASTPALQGPSDTNTGLFFPAADTIAFAEGGTEALRIDSSGRVGIGTSSPSYILEVRQDSSGVPVGINMVDTNASGRSYSIRSDAGQLRFRDVTGSADRVTLDSSGRLGIGTTSPAYNLSIFNNSNNFVHFSATGDAIAGSLIGRASSTDLRIQNSENAAISFQTNNTERARIDSSGRLLVGTSSARAMLGITPGIQSEGTSFAQGNLSLTVNSTAGNQYPILSFARSGGTTLGSNTIVSNGDIIGKIFFVAADGVDMDSSIATIEAVVDGTPGANDLPGRLVFSTTADGASSPSERWRIDNAGSLVGVAGSAFVAPYVYNTTTATAANVNVDATGFLRRSTSSIKYKTNVETIQDQYADAILGCRPVWYQSTCEADKPEWGHWGFIAEEVAEIDPRLCFFKEEEDGTLEPEGVQYDRFVPHLLNLIKRQGEAIAELQVEVAALKAQ